MGELLAIKVWHEGRAIGASKWNLERIVIEDKIKMTRYGPRHPRHEYALYLGAASLVAFMACAWFLLRDVRHMYGGA
jgi:hypothetical protein